MLFPQIVKIIEQYLREKVFVPSMSDIKDIGLSPYYGLVIEF